jgi:hypothetical protein
MIAGSPPAGQPPKSVSWDEATKPAPEPDRHLLFVGCPPFYITDVFISHETKYNKDKTTGEGKIIRINGIRDINVIGDLTNVVKYRTTSLPVINQLEKVLPKYGSGDGHFRIPLGPVTMINYQPPPTKEDPNPKAYYKIVAAPAPA